jgi:hypothetical protein
MPSPYTLESPPPVEPPVGVMELTAWSIAVRLWRAHQPDSLLRAECVACQAAWPCATWQVADGIIADLGVPGRAGPVAPPVSPAPPAPVPVPVPAGSSAPAPEPPPGRHARLARRGPMPPRLVGAEGSTQEIPRVTDSPFVGAYRRE